MEHPRLPSQAAEEDNRDPQQALPKLDRVTSYANTETESVFNDNASETAALISRRTQSQLLLSRGLQVPSRGKTITRGFDYPTSLAESGVTAKDWEAFNDEIRSYAKLSRKQWLETVRGTTGAILVGGLIVGFFGLAAAYLGVNMRRNRETRNFVAAKKSGTVIECITRWNTEYFFEKGLVVRVDVPGEIDDLSSMELSTSKTPLTYSNRAEIAEVVAFDENEAEDSSMSDRRTTPSSHSFSSTKSGQEKEVSSKARSKLEKAEEKSRKQEERARKKAAQRVRIVLVPYDPDDPSNTQSSLAIGQPVESGAAAISQNTGQLTGGSAKETKPSDVVDQQKTERGSGHRQPPGFSMGQRYL